MEVVGSPVGSLQYQIEFVNKQADKIIDELNLVEKLVTAAPSSREGRVQLMYQVTRMCSAQRMTHLLRTCNPDVTRHAASRVDVAIANTVYRITRTLPLLPREGTAQLRQLIHRLFLSIRRGGNGFISCVDVREGAYVASWLQSAPTIARIYPIAAQTDGAGACMYHSHFGCIG